MRKVRAYTVRRELLEQPMLTLWGGQGREMLHVPRWVVYGEPMERGGRWVRMRVLETQAEALELIHRWQDRQRSLVARVG